MLQLGHTFLNSVSSESHTKHVQHSSLRSWTLGLRLQCSWQYDGAQAINFQTVDRFKCYPDRKQMEKKKTNKKQEHKPEGPHLAQTRRATFGVVLQMVGFFLFLFLFFPQSEAEMIKRQRSRS